MRSFRRFVLALLLAGVHSSVVAANWPAWRGPEGIGVTRETGFPTRWSVRENVRWHMPLPDSGNSTPIVWNDRVFITQAIAKEHRRTLMCFDRRDGKLLWQSGVTFAEPEISHETNPQCSASPVTDGERVIVFHGSAGVYCYDFSGRELWRRDLGKQRHIWGNGASPMLHQNLCILNFGPGERTFLIALNKHTGETVWQVNEPGGDSGEKKPEQKSALWIGSWTTPVAASIHGRDELLMSFPNRVCAFDPKTGREFWTCEGLNPLVYTSPIYKGDVVVAMGGYNGSALAVRAGGSGDVTGTHRLWHTPRTKQRIGSGVIAGDHIYILNDPGVAECLDLKSGATVWEERLRGPGVNSTSWSSMVLTGDQIYAVNQSGDTFVVRASPRFEVISTNSVNERTLSSLAFSDKEIFLRSYEQLWCFRAER